jgi:hypothetical protein
MPRPLPTCRARVLVAWIAALSGCERVEQIPTALNLASPRPTSTAEGTSEAKAQNMEPEWNDKSREELRESIHRFVLGELRLAKNDRETILTSCREIYIDDECPESERSSMIEFATKEFEAASGRIESEKSGWPKVTDCDRLDRVEASLRERGIVLWQVSPCCDTCTMGELADRVDVINGRHPGFRGRLRGYAFFIDQNMPDMLSDSTKISVYLGYGWLSSDGSKVAEDVYEKNALGIANEVCDRLRAEGLDVDWNGSFDRKIGVAINWQRRDMHQ